MRHTMHLAILISMAIGLGLSAVSCTYVPTLVYKRAFPKERQLSNWRVEIRIEKRVFDGDIGFVPSYHVMLSAERRGWKPGEELGVDSIRFYPSDSNWVAGEPAWEIPITSWDVSPKSDMLTLTLETPFEWHPRALLSVVYRLRDKKQQNDRRLVVDYKLKLHKGKGWSYFFAGP